MDVFLVKLSVVHICFLHNLEKEIKLNNIFLKSLEYFQQTKKVTHFHDSCYPRFLAVAVIKESQLPFFHLPHKVACLEMIDSLEELSRR